VREQLIARGLDRMHAVGFTATGVQDVVADAGVPKGSFYHYFDSKEAFAIAVIDAYAAELAAPLQALLLDEVRSPTDGLAAYFRESAARYGAMGCLLGNFGTEMPGQSEVIRQRLAMHFDAWTRLVGAVLRKAQTTGELDAAADADALAAFAVNSWEGAIMRMKVDQSMRPLETFFATFFGGVLRSR
jgi:TetR/AcrR family transcriptional repressor of nem operon